MKLTLYGEEVEFHGFELTQYNLNGALAVLARLVWPDEQRPEHVPISVNLYHGQETESHQLGKDQFVAKAYSEGAQLFGALIEAKLIEVVPDTNLVKTGYVELPICRLTAKGRSLILKNQTT